MKRVLLVVAVTTGVLGVGAWSADSARASDAPAVEDPVVEDPVVEGKAARP